MQRPKSFYINIVNSFKTNGPCRLRHDPKDIFHCDKFHGVRETDRRRCPLKNMDLFPPYNYTVQECANDLERYYHPDCYKKKGCIKFTTTGTCPRGDLCTFRHVTSAGVDLDAVYQPPSKARVAEEQLVNDETTAAKINQRIMETYKTSVCQADHSAQGSRPKEQCPNFHIDLQANEQRRNPFQVEYTPLLCRGVRELHKPDGTVIFVNECPFDTECRYSHNKCEILYHPMNFRTFMCKHGAKCFRGSYCFAAHQPALKRESTPMRNLNEISHDQLEDLQDESNVQVEVQVEEAKIVVPEISAEELFEELFQQFGSRDNFNLKKLVQLVRDPFLHNCNQLGENRYDMLGALFHILPMTQGRLPSSTFGLTDEDVERARIWITNQTGISDPKLGIDSFQDLILKLETAFPTEKPKPAVQVEQGQLVQIPGSRTKFYLKDEVGRGHCGTVYKGQRSEYEGGVERAVAVKRMDANDSSQVISRVQKEVELLREARHPNIVEYFEYCESRDYQAHYLYIIMEYCPTTLENFLKSEERKICSPDKLKGMVTDLLNGINYLHKNKIMHRDIKPGNILISSHGKLKLCDMERSIKIDSGESSVITQVVGTQKYMAPELMDGEERKRKDFFATDIWSCGVVIAEILSGDFPFGKGIMEILVNIAEVKLKVKLNPVEEDLIMSMLKSNPESRASIVTCLEHPFFYQEKDIILLLRSVHQLRKTKIGKEEPSLVMLINYGIQNVGLGEDRIFGKEGWKSLIEPALMAAMDKYKENHAKATRTGTAVENDLHYNTHSVSSLASFARNLVEHRSDLPAEFQRIFSKGPIAYLQAKFPKLVVRIYRALQEKQNLISQKIEELKKEKEEYEKILIRQ
eukprot:TRINITY_DN2497_c0_g1_i1.p1 TRINITY_DN2497_c0_g1~~TRINITY_DN2497_c0_g1_i1.p1  ORF type:complete len:863 (+),score=252.76 TRINITY_DN2497_c0_g1_i1:35-2623(+)